MVCTFAREKILYEAIFPVCLDTRRVTYCCDTELSYYPEYIRRIDMVCILNLSKLLLYYNINIKYISESVNLKMS